MWTRAAIFRIVIMIVVENNLLLKSLFQNPLFKTLIEECPIVTVVQPKNELFIRNST